MKACTVCGAISQEARCPLHRRDANASWSKDRNRGAQDRFRKRILRLAGFRCQAMIDGFRCDITGAKNLEAHHTVPGDDNQGAALCRPEPFGHGHHKLFDSHAR